MEAGESSLVPLVIVNASATTASRKRKLSANPKNAKYWSARTRSLGMLFLNARAARGTTAHLLTWLIFGKFPLAGQTRRGNVSCWSRRAIPAGSQVWQKSLNYRTQSLQRAQGVHEGSDEGMDRIRPDQFWARGRGDDQSYPINFSRLLRATSRRPRNHRAAENGDELPRPHSTLSFMMPESEYQMISYGRSTIAAPQWAPVT